jgi:hypothetical protein
MSNIKKRNLFTMMKEWHCEFIDKKGQKSTFNIHLGESNELIINGYKTLIKNDFTFEKAFRRNHDKNNNPFFEMDFQHYYYSYKHELEKCFNEFKEEIEDNMLNSNQTTKEEYITSIYDEIRNFWINNTLYLEHLESIKPNRENLPNDLKDYIKKKGLSFDNLDEIELGEECKLFLKVRNYDIVERLESEPSRFASYYSYKGIDEIYRNTSTINIEEISKFMNEFLNIKYLPYLKEFYEVNKSKEVKIFNHKLEESQFQIILELVNKISLFNKILTIDELKSIFNCNHSTYFIVNNNQELATLFNQLQPKFISRYWQSIIEQNKLFKGIKDKFITAKNLSSSYQNADSETENNKLIIATIKQMN